MLELQGKYGTAKVYTDNIEETAVGQVIGMLNAPMMEGATMRIMPDVHAGKGATVGTTIMFDEGKVTKACPNVVGSDVGCGILMWKVDVDKADLDLVRLGKAVARVVPSGFTVHQSQFRNQEVVEGLTIDLSASQKSRILKSVGTLGGGNHYIELAEDQDGGIWLSVHSGSRNLGIQVAKTHQEIAEKENYTFVDKEVIIADLKARGQEEKIQEALASAKNGERITKDKDLAYLEGEYLDNYLNDMTIAQKYAVTNREQMLKAITSAMGWGVIDKFDSIHNYIDVENGIIRKGATSAQDGERLVIPLNMKDGSLICMGKGNADWNFSAPHGAGRIMSRSKAKQMIDVEDYKAQMEGIYTTSVGVNTLDEAPEAYKSADEIIANIKDSVDIVHHLVPLYNFKDNSASKGYGKKHRK